ncbi:MAG TPA: cellulase family glycosylhydrolase [Ktedonobacterales bacterium]
MSRGDRLRRLRAANLVALLAVALLASAACASGHSGVASAPTATRPPATPTATTDPWITEGLSVSSTHILAPDGRALTLLGAARYSLEFECQGDGHFQQADFQAMRAWGMNTVRIPLSSGFWRNLGNGCPTYRATVAAAVANAEAAGLYVILDLQRDAPFSLPQDVAGGGEQCPLPDAKYDLAFWRQVAAQYGHAPRVLFDLFGEPHDISWEQWRHGGPITSSCYGYASERTYTAIGMPTLAAAVRAVAPRSIIIVSGLDWGYDLSGIDRQSAIPLRNILYATHPWNHTTVMQPSDWPRAFGTTARQLPVIATEFGAYDCRTGYLATALDYFARLGVSYLAWAWTPGGCQTPGLLANWSGAPSVPYGQYIRRRMLAAAAANPPLPLG